MAERSIATPRQTDWPREATRSSERFATPPVDIFEDEGGLVVIADLPGAEPGTLDVRLAGGVLTIHAPASRAQPAGNVVYREYELTGFYREFQLPEEVDPAGIQAELKDGVLALHLPRLAPGQPTCIEVHTG